MSTNQRKYVTEALDLIEHKSVELSAAIDEVVDYMVDTMTEDEQLEVLAMYGHRDLSEPRPVATGVVAGYPSFHSS